MRYFIIGLVYMFLFQVVQPGYSQIPKPGMVDVLVDFNHVLRPWDGFGVNYVETSQTDDYTAWPQDYGSFSLLDPRDRDSIVEMVFGVDGLQPAIIKMFLDPLHQELSGGPFDHMTTTRNMRDFVKRGLQKYEHLGMDLSVITTLYGPPAYITLQKEIRGRDLDLEHTEDLARYLISWTRFLKDEGIPVQYVSLHNEGESYLRWPEDGSNNSEMVRTGHDYNFFWSPEQINDFIKVLRSLMDREGLSDVGITNGEPTNWYRFAAWGYAGALCRDREALSDLALITSHGFYVGDISAGRWYGPHTSRGIDMIREKRTEMRAWVTSTAWNAIIRDSLVDGSIEKHYDMNAEFIKQVHGNIYEAKVNGLIPWALIQNAARWNKPDPNPGCAFRVYEDGTFEINKAYYYYKQVTSAGRPGMGVAYTEAMDSEIAVIAFASLRTHHPDAFVVTNFGKQHKELHIKINGNTHRRYIAVRTSGNEVYQYRETACTDEKGGENFHTLGEFPVEKEGIRYFAPAGSVTTFFCEPEEQMKP